MNTDKATTVWGCVMAVGMAVFTYLQSGGDMKGVGFWAGMVAAAGAAVKGYYTNK